MITPFDLLLYRLLLLYRILLFLPLPHPHHHPLTLSIPLTAPINPESLTDGPEAGIRPDQLVVVVAPVVRGGVGVGGCGDDGDVVQDFAEEEVALLAEGGDGGVALFLLLRLGVGFVGCFCCCC